MRFAAKLAILMLIIIIIIVIGVVLSTRSAAVKVMDDEITGNIENHVSTTMGELDRILFDRFSDIKILASEATVSSRDSTSKQITDRMIQYRNQYKFYASLSFFDINGIKVADTEGLNIGKKLNPGKYWEETIKNGFSAASDIGIDEDLKIPVIYFATLVKDKDGTPFGMLVARMPVTRLYEVTENTFLLANKEFSPDIDLIDKEGLLIYSNHNRAGVLKENLFNSDVIVKDWKEGRLGNISSFKPVGQEYIYFFSGEKGYLDFKGNSWTQITRVSTKTIYEPIFAYEKRLVGIVIPIVAIAIILVIALSYLMTKQIVKLKNAAGEVSKGNLDVKVNYKSRDEIGQLASSFNIMIENLKISRKTIHNQTRTLEKKVEQRTKEYQEAATRAQVADSAKSEFLANMSHEIRTPMNAILGFSEILKEQLSEPKYREYIDIIITSSKTLLGLINDILDLSKIEAGKMEFQYKPVDTHSLFSDIKKIFANKINDKGLKFLTDIDNKLPSSLLLDEVRIRQILFNLVGNAVKFTDKGYIELKVKGDFYPDRSKIDLIFSVKDTGIGISEDGKKIIFDAFKQSSGQSMKKYGGTGLGLTITKRLVEMMNGEISVESIIGKGSIFKIKIKEVSVATVGPDNEDRKPEYENIKFNRQKVLVADDVQSNRLLLSEILSIYGLNVLIALNGKEAISIAKNNDPDIILMDLRMPVMDGYEAIKVLKGNNRLKNIPVIVLTASAMKSTEEDIKKIKCDGYIRKPVDRYELIAELKKYLK